MVHYAEELAGVHPHPNRCHSLFPVLSDVVFLVLSGLDAHHTGTVYSDVPGIFGFL